jgi:hypothetical protein
VVDEQLQLPGLEPPRRVEAARRHVRADGRARLLLELARRGLPEDAWPVAAALVLALDREAPRA